MYRFSSSRRVAGALARTTTPWATTTPRATTPMARASPSISPLISPIARLQPHRRFVKLSASQASTARGYSTVINIIAGAYLGGLVICTGSLYWLYHDANERQKIPFELPFDQQIEAVKAINKDDVIRSPQYAEKHYRKLLQAISDKTPSEDLDHDDYDASDKFDFPMIRASVLLADKSNAFANFYIDIILRYAKALVSRNKPDSAEKILKKVINNDDIFFRIGNAESLSQACRILAKISTARTPETPQENTELQVAYMMRSLDMLTQTHPTLKVDSHFCVQENSKMTNEFLACLNQIAFIYARGSRDPRIIKSKEDEAELLTESLNIYLSNLKALTTMQEDIGNPDSPVAKRNFPLFDATPLNLTIQIASLKAHISEIIWAKGFHRNAIGWSEEVVDLLFDYYNESSKSAPILISTLDNLTKMYAKINDKVNSERCQRMTKGIEVYESDRQSWYDETLARVSKIIYIKGPLGIIEKALTERYGKNQPVPNIEEFDELD